MVSEVFAEDEQSSSWLSFDVAGHFESLIRPTVIQHNTYVYMYLYSIYTYKCTGCVHTQTCWTKESKAYVIRTCNGSRLVFMYFSFNYFSVIG